MSVLNPRDHRINVRLSANEFKELKVACTRCGARSISDFLRYSLLQSSDAPGSTTDLLGGRLADVDLRVTALEIRVTQLSRLVADKHSPERQNDTSAHGDNGKLRSL